MTQFYVEPNRENDPYALPDAEVFYISGQEYAAREIENETELAHEYALEYHRIFADIKHVKWFRDSLAADIGDGWYWWSCFPGCLPDSDPLGPFASKQDAISDARS